MSPRSSQLPSHAPIKTPRYTDEHAKAGLDFPFPGHRNLAKPVPGY